MSIHEECGVFGSYAAGEMAPRPAELCYYGLYALQHRGQESCGIAVNDRGVIRCHKDAGLVEQVFRPEALKSLPEGRIAVAHVRYGTTGSGDRTNAQPLVVNHIKGAMALAHNGNLANAYDLRSELELTGTIFHTTADTEIITHLIVRERVACPSIEEAVSRAMDRMQGAYSLVIMSPAKLIAVRDPHGFRPLCYGVREDGTYVVASESCALAAVGAVFLRDLEPGEILIFDQEGVRSRREHCGTAARSSCVFEYIYFARPDSVIDGCCVHEARLRAGRALARTYPVEADVVIGVPDSGLDAAVGYAREAGIPYEIGFIKNKYVGRTFIAPDQKDRVEKVQIKLQPIRSVVEGKRLVVIDDSIVRGTTSAQIVSILRQAGAAEVHMRVTAPPFRHPCFYGTDIDSGDALIANRHTIPEICEQIGADSLGYLAIEDAKHMAGDDLAGSLCTACFSGAYPTPVPREKGKNRFEQRIGE